MTLLRTTAWAILTYASLGIGIIALPYVLGDPQRYDPIFRDKYIAHLAIVHVHGAASVLALISGPFQFWSELRVASPRLHRVLGWLYVVGVVGGSITGFYMGMRAYGGPSSQLAFSTMSVIWLCTCVRAVRAAVGGDLRAHRRWMLRCFAMTFGAVVSRACLATLVEYGFGFDLAYPCAAWGAWLSCLVGVEVHLWAEVGGFHVSIDPRVCGGDEIV